MTNLLTLIKKGILPWTTTTEQSIQNHIDNLFFCGYIEEESTCCDNVGVCNACQRNWLDAKYDPSRENIEEQKLWLALFKNKAPTAQTEGNL